MPKKVIAIPSATLVLLALAGPSCDGAGEPDLGASSEQLAVQAASPQLTGPRVAYVQDEALVTLRPEVGEGVGLGAITALGHRVERRLGFEKAPASPLNRTFLLRLSEGTTVEQALAELSAQPEVEAAQPNYLYFPSEVPSDPYFNMAWAHRNLGDNTPFQGNPGLYNPDPRVADMDMDTPEANDEIARRGFTPSTIIVGVIDSGVDYTHPDLAAIMWPGRGYDFYSNDSNPMDEDSHGTHVAGAIAAIHNSIGVYGTATNVQIMALRFIGPTGGTTANAIAAINYGVTHGAQVLNNSWGGGAYDASLAAAIAAARDQGVLFVVASGNDGTDNDTTPSYPGNYPYENVISVGSSSAWGDGSLFSNYGLTTVHLYAPGEEIISTTPNILTGYPESLYQICMWDSANSVWLSWSGTSMAAPHASGAAAIVYGLAPNLITGWAGMSPVQRVSAIRQRLMDRSQRWASLAGLSVTGGHLNVFNLVEEDTTAPATPALSVHLTQSRRVLLRTTATGDDGNTGQANYYDLRVAEGATFDYATAEPIIGLWTPSPVGQLDNFTIGGLSPGTTYRFGLEVVDNAGNRSALSNVVAITTPSETVLLDDDVEGGINGWTGDWGQVTTQSNSPTHSWTDSPGGNYPNNANLYLVSPELVVNDQMVRLSFWQRYDLQANADYGTIQIRTYDGATWSAWTSVDQVTGTNTTWHEWSGTLSATGQRVQLRFWLSSNASVRRDGWYIDDILVTAVGDAPDTLVVDETFGNATNWTLAPTWAVQGGALDDSPGANYRANNRSSATLSTGVDLSNAISASINFDLVSCSYEDNYDWLIWEYSLDNVQWRIITGFTGTPSGTQEVNLTPLIGYDSVYFRFRSYTDYTINEAGCRLDNLQIWIKEPVTCTGDPDCDDGDACNGAETCVLATGNCQPGTPLVCNDGNVCTTDSCNPATGCAYANNALPCPDATLCNGNEVCSGGTCQPDTPLSCNDGNVCTTDSCNPATGCAYANNALPCPDGTLCNGNEVCSGGACQAGTPLSCNDGNVCTTDSCNPATGCAYANNALPCPDATLCNGNEVCSGGACQAGTPLTCNDGNVCTTDSCNPATGCAYANNALPCPDATLCNGNEVCSGGACQAGTPLTCNDGNVCTTDSCNPATGCAYANNALPCPDGTLCNGNEVCSGGACQPGTPLTCNDGNVCTTDSCNPATGCAYANNALPCPDATLCNGNEVCSGGACQAGTPLTCNDGNVCTTDSCNPATGCAYANNALPCPDATLCNGNEVCSGGACQAGTPLTCNDGNVCTTDSCNPATGCAYANNALPCPDATLCNGNEVCSGGACQAGTPLSCNDGNVCTTDSCNPATGCAYANNALPCPDATLCNGNEVCSGGACQAGTPLTCNDGNVCTTDSCNPATGCAYANNALPCPDATLCNGNEVCSGGACQAGTPLTCNDGNVCTTDSCNPATGCAYANNALPCPDGDPCNGDEACAAGTCQAGAPLDADSDGYAPVACGGLDCNDGDPTVNPGAYEGGLGDPSCSDAVDNDCDGNTDLEQPSCSLCLADADCSDGNVCNGMETCMLATGNCQPGTPLACDDGNLCTSDSCNPGTGCAYANNTLPCPDGNACNGSEVCSAGSCQAGTPLTCNDGNVCTTDSCNPGTGCVFANNTLPCPDGNACNGSEVCGGGSCQAGTPLSCNDGNVCTTDSCNPATGCAYANNTLPCPDGNACNGSEVCSAGSCLAGTPLTCNDGNVCTTDSCNPGTGCAFANNTLPCPDGNACNGSEVCSAGSCLAGTPLSCNDGNVCTTDSCNPATGCAYANNALPCPDATLCNGNEVCSGGACQPGTPLTCNDGNVCTTDSCNPATGCAYASNALPCPDGDLCNGNEACSGGTCQAGTPLVCDDGNICTTDSCAPATGCANTNNSLPCSNGDLCDGNEVCSGGACQAGTPLTCDDGNVCTTDSCNPATGCAYASNALPCPDGDLCNGNEACSGGSCRAGTPLVCDDGNPCTTDLCDPATGCATTHNTLPCPDGTLCNGNEVCSGGACQAGTPLVCDDGNPCTTDSCNAATGCASTDNTDPCDDGDACTSGDTCAAATCQGVPLDADGDGYGPLACGGLDCDDGDPEVNPGAFEGGLGDPSCSDGLDNDCDGNIDDEQPACSICAQDADCVDGNPCNGDEVCAAGSCQPGTPLDCDDGNACTTDSCDPAVGCTHADNTLPCADGDPCNGDEVCGSGSCQPGTPLACDDSDACNGLEGCDPSTGCVPGTPPACDDGEPCTDDGCDPAAGCTSTPNSAPCDDGNPCTEGDACSAGACQPGTNTCQCAADADCAPFEDADLCNGALVCQGDVCVVDPATVIVCDPSADTACRKAACDPATGACAPADQPDASACDDGDACTSDDACLAGECAGTLLACDDGDACNGLEACDPASGCQVGTPLVCDDTNPCTDDGCDPASGCVFTPNTAPCDDGNPCTEGDTCSAGACQPGPNSCPCATTADCAPFEDADLCNGTLVCQDSACVVDPATVIVCDSSADTACRKAACDPATGACALVDQPDTSPCDDGDACTSADACLAGVCTGTPLSCDDDNPCTGDRCDAASGACQHDALPDGAACPDGACQAGVCQPTEDGGDGGTSDQDLTHVSGGGCACGASSSPLEAGSLGLLGLALLILRTRVASRHGTRNSSRGKSRSSF